MPLRLGSGSGEGRVEHLAGRNPVLEALRAGREVHRVLVAESAHGPAVREIVAQARERGIPIRLVARSSLDELVGELHHQGVVAEAAPFAYADLDDILAHALSRSEPPLVLVLDSLQDPQNFGTLLRTAQAVGAHGVVIPLHRSVSVTPAVARASAGAVEHLRIARVTNLPRTLAALKERGLWVFGLEMDAPQPFWDADLRGGVALVVGAEGEGLGRLVRERCDALLRLPMAESAMQSLNASTAGSIVLYDAFRQRRIGASTRPGGGASGA